MLTLDKYAKYNPRCEIEHEGVKVLYATPNLQTKWRADTLYEKEPITLQWIGEFSKGDVMVDVGANVGMYTIWAAKTRGARVFAFEPEAQNYALLNRNIVLNGLGGQVTAYCLALSDSNGMGELHLSSLDAGGSCHSFGEKLDFKQEPMLPKYSQGCVSARLDHLVETAVVPVPHHIKIDVDGIEPKVVAGMRNVLNERAVRSVLIEINQNLADHRQLVLDMQVAGFTYDRAQVTAAERKEGPFKGQAEYVFRR